MSPRAKLVLQIATLLTACGLSVASAQAHYYWPRPQPKNPPPRVPHVLPLGGGHAPWVTTCSSECGYPTGLYKVCRDPSGRTVSKTLVSLNACIR